jgi:uncharacterized protein YbaP (TraB family)
MIRYVFSLLFLLVLALPATAKDPPPCQGRNLLEELKVRDRKAYDRVMAEAAAMPNGDAILWKIEAKAGTAPSWLLGTAHLTDPRITALPPAAKAALENARVVALELAEATDMRRLTMATMSQARFLVMPPGQNMWDLIPDADEEAIRASPHYPGQMSAQFAVMQPWVVAAALSVPPCERRRQTAGLATLDVTIGATALARGIPVEGLEKIEEHLGLFAGMPLETQARYLIAVGRVGELVGDYVETLVQLYLSRELTALMPLSKHADPAMANDLELMTFFERDLIVKRNRVMQQRASALIDGGNAFIAVGALHLPGEEGLVSLLRDAGYTVTAIE